MDSAASIEGQGGPGPLRGWATILLGLVLAVALLFAGQWVAMRVPVADIASGIAVFYVAVFAPLLLLSLVFGRIERRPVMRAGEKPAMWTALGLVAGVGGLAASLGIVWLAGDVSVARAALNLPLLGVAVALLAVLSEEALFRGWLLPALVQRCGIWPAVLLSAAAFSLFHLIGGAAQLVSFLNLMLGGTWFALLALRSGGIVAPVAAHFGWNIAEDLGLGLIPNPGTGEFGALRDLDMIGPAHWGGSDEGINASFAMTLVLIALILPLLPGVRKTKRFPQPASG